MVKKHKKSELLVQMANPTSICGLVVYISSSDLEVAWLDALVNSFCCFALIDFCNGAKSNLFISLGHDGDSSYVFTV